VCIRLFYDTIKGGDYRAREANVHRLAEVSANIIDQCVAQGVPFAREYGGLLKQPIVLVVHKFNVLFMLQVKLVSNY
jgi:succinate dehydrogenase/fumarate reductase flavoprotein subunit